MDTRTVPHNTDRSQHEASEQVGTEARVQPNTRLELWGGIECTLNRIHDRFQDQLLLSGHYDRPQDIDRLAELGIKRLRYPVLWERVAPESAGQHDFTHADQSLKRLRELGIEPVVGLLHHGSGPRYTDLLDADFPEKFASYARIVAERYPWIEHWTPINEPLTTARFSCLYGHWYPHHRSDLSFSMALLNQVKATVLAMREIRKINPSAKLIQTEDLGKTHSTSVLAYQAAFENERRWITYDLLNSRFDDAHSIWSFMLWAGVEERDLRWFTENRAKPDIIGVNHYLTSERFLDHRLERYPEQLHGGNGKHAYVDVEAVRALKDLPAGPRELLRETWERYHTPMAVTEVHLGCTREEQLRWIKEVWDAAETVRRNGADVRAVTLWSLFGAYDWNGLVTSLNGHYEPGAFDLRSVEPRTTAIGQLAKELASGAEPKLSFLSSPGWWRRHDRFIDPEMKLRSSKLHFELAEAELARRDAHPLIITGATGTLGRAFARICELRGLPYRLLSRADLDIADRTMVEAVLDELKPWGIVNAAGYVRVDDAEKERDRAKRENTIGAGILAEETADRNIRLVTFSSDLVFDGSKGSAYIESDSVSPINFYGETKVRAEEIVRASNPGALIARTSAFFGPWDQYNFIATTLRHLSAGEIVLVPNDQVVSPTYVPDLVHAVLDLLIDGEGGVWHLTSRGHLSWFELASRAAQLFGHRNDNVIGCVTSEMRLAARRPMFSALGSERANLLPELDDALRRMVHDHHAERTRRTLSEAAEVKWEKKGAVLSRKKTTLPGFASRTSMRSRGSIGPMN